MRCEDINSIWFARSGALQLGDDLQILDAVNNEYNAIAALFAEACEDDRTN